MSEQHSGRQLSLWRRERHATDFGVVANNDVSVRIRGVNPIHNVVKESARSKATMGVRFDQLRAIYQLRPSWSEPDDQQFTKIVVYEIAIAIPDPETGSPTPLSSECLVFPDTFAVAESDHAIHRNCRSRRNDRLPQLELS